MSVLVEQYGNESIIVFTFSDEVSKSAIFAAYAQSIELARTLAGPVYRIYDLRQAQSNYVTIATALIQCIQDATGAKIYPSLAAVFVGTSTMQSWFDETVAVVFTSMEAAVSFARLQVDAKVAL